MWPAVYCAKQQVRELQSPSATRKADIHMLRSTVLYFAYNTLGHLALPAVLARLAIKGWKQPEYYARLGERLGLDRTGARQGCIWLHTVSVGEVQAATSLIQHLLAHYPDRDLLLTTTTPTGSRLVQDKFGEQVKHCYLPYDLTWAVQGFLRTHRPALALFMETEIWPNMFRRCHSLGIPLLLLSARISSSSCQGYRKVKPLIQASLNSCSRILAQSQADASRLIGLGADQDRIMVSGNLKFDIHVPQEQIQAGISLRQELWPQRPVWIAASTHPGEEEQLLQAQARIQEQLPQSLLILAPRHPQRFERVFALCREQGFDVCRRSRASTAQAAGCRIYLADSMGELLSLYPAADAAFVGGSLVDTGGHNLLEPACMGLPVLSGPHLDNFQQVASILQHKQALGIVRQPEELAREVLALLQDSNLASARGQKARQAVQENQGALELTLEQISRLLQQC